MITYNEVNHIEDVINTVNFTNEIIIVDAFSTDGTPEKLSKFKNVKVIQRAFKNFADQRNFALKQASHNWILFIDADERIPNPLKNEILNEVSSNNGTAAFLVKRLYFFKKKRIRFSGFQTDTTYRLFKKGTVSYIEDKIVHEMPKIDGKSKLLKNTMLHYCFDSAEHYKSKMEHYAKLKALELHSKGKKPNVYNLHIRPIIKFLTNYIFRLGILDGKEGFQICYLSAYGVRFRYQELKKLTR
ncbi:glycosyltransferase family 2 protein [Algibacter pectinivorans]|uniref:Glycosyltransferase involved in cell wall bisynthesis n=1 Tax=Algibacter pectinivorans TaxID=870482 RepID=A0A1I1RDL7_9FLAO|nr:glycosyltransferase family 2 protein [Algibacter pectinivorans]SFD32476.1 Glycosyltransferase involved in cell wall bisynthesis [Algibacter pectinivorans]